MELDLLQFVYREKMKQVRYVNFLIVIGYMVAKVQPLPFLEGLSCWLGIPIFSSAHVCGEVLGGECINKKPEFENT